MATLTFAQWEKQHYPSSVGANRQARVQAYQRQQAAQRAAAAPTPAASTPAPAPERPRYTPSDALDEEGSANKTALDRQYAEANISSAREHSDAIANINAQRPLVEQARDDGYRDVDNNAAARGISRSGVRTEARTRVGADADRQLNALADSARRYNERYSEDSKRRATDYGTDVSNNLISSNVRERAAWDERFGDDALETANPATPEKQKAAMTYKDFLKGRKSTNALAKAWDARYNYNQRFGA